MKSIINTFNNKIQTIYTLFSLNKSKPSNINIVLFVNSSRGCKLYSYPNFQIKNRKIKKNQIKNHSSVEGLKL